MPGWDNPIMQIHGQPAGLGLIQRGLDNREQIGSAAGQVFGGRDFNDQTFQPLAGTDGGQPIYGFGDDGLGGVTASAPAAPTAGGGAALGDLADLADVAFI